MIKIKYINDINNIINSFMNCINTDIKKLYIKNHNNNYNYNNNVIDKLLDSELEFIKKNIFIVDKKMKKLDAKLINLNEIIKSNIWKICIYTDMFFNFPFTLNDVIFMPYSYIKNCVKSYDNTKFQITMIHERIHILQRYNQKLWNEYIKNNTNWIIFNNNDFKLNILSTLYNTNKIINPDTFYLDKIFFLNINNQLYYGELIKNNFNNNIKPLWYEVKYKNNNKNENQLELYPTHNLISNYEHPYEELAYLLSNEL
jgi:hypothetical protein